MRVLIIAYYYPPLNTGGTMRPYKIGKYLAQMGHEVVVLTHAYGGDKTEPGNPLTLRVNDISYNKERVGWWRRFQWLVLRGITELLNVFGIYHSIYSWWKRGAVGLGKKHIEQERPDIIIATYPPVETLEVGIELSRFFTIPLLVDFRDGLMFEAIEARRMQRYPCIRRRYRQIEESALGQAVAVTTIAPPITDYYQEKYHPSFVETISNAFDPGDLEGLDEEVGFHKSYFHLVFTGRFALSCDYNQVGYFFDAVRLLLKKQPLLETRLRIHLIGEYRSREFVALQDMIDAGVIQCHGFVERRHALAYQAAADLLLIITPPDRRSATSTKIFEYLYARKPILALTHQTVLEDIINETKTGWVVHPHDPKGIAGLLEKIISDQTFYHALQPDLQSIEQYSVKTQVEKLDGLLKRIIAGAKKGVSLNKSVDSQSPMNYSKE